jgi:hypothetical protein
MFIIQYSYSIYNILGIVQNSTGVVWVQYSAVTVQYGGLHNTGTVRVLLDLVRGNETYKGFNLGFSFSINFSEGHVYVLGAYGERVSIRDVFAFGAAKLHLLLGEPPPQPPAVQSRYNLGACLSGCGLCISVSEFRGFRPPPQCFFFSPYCLHPLLGPRQRISYRPR